MNNEYIVEIDEQEAITILLKGESVWDIFGQEYKIINDNLRIKIGEETSGKDKWSFVELDFSKMLNMRWFLKF